MRSARGVAVRLKSERSQGNVTDWPSTLPPCPILRAVIGRVVAAGADHVERMWCEMSDKPTGVAAAHAAAWDITRQLEYAADTCLYEPAAVLMRNAKDEIERRRWIPVGERLPKDGDHVIVWMPDCPHHPCGMDMGSCMTDSWGVSWIVSGGRSAFPTHWMPLPAPPTDAK